MKLLTKKQRRNRLFGKYAILLAIGGILYYFIEILYRGYSHPTMMLVGGICFILCGLLNEVFPWSMPLTHQMAIADIAITVVEFIAGVILNIWLGLGIWDYSNLPLNVMGQICIPFMIIWFFLSAPAIILDDYLRYWLFGEEKVKYKIF